MSSQTERCQRTQQVDVGALIARSHRLIREIAQASIDPYEKVPSRIRHAAYEVEAVLPMEGRKE